MNAIALAYSGGLDSSVILTWLKEEFGVPVIAYVADVGQNEDFEAVREKAVRTGASGVVIKDLKDEFVSEYVFEALKANAGGGKGPHFGVLSMKPRRRRLA